MQHRSLLPTFSEAPWPVVGPHPGLGNARESGDRWVENEGTLRAATTVDRGPPVCPDALKEIVEVLKMGPFSYIEGIR
jgi:hypothetical protein